MNAFDKSILALNDEHRATVNAPTRAQGLLVAALAVTDGFKLENTSRGEAVTEAEWLALCRNAYWRAREALQAGGS